MNKSNDENNNSCENRNTNSESAILAAMQELKRLLKEEKRWVEHNRIESCYPNSGPLRRELYPKAAILRDVPKPNLPEAIEIVYVRQVCGDESVLPFKSCEQGRESFQGAEKDVIWLDEECPKDIYVECLIRTMTTNGLLILTFTPLNGLTELVKDFLREGYQPKETL